MPDDIFYKSNRGQPTPTVPPRLPPQTYDTSCESGFRWNDETKQCVDQREPCPPLYRMVNGNCVLIQEPDDSLPVTYTNGASSWGLGTWAIIGIAAYVIFAGDSKKRR